VIGPFRVEGHAIVGDDDHICDGEGRMPPQLRHDADWRYFQAHLDRSAIVVTGRLGHESHPNKPGRRRLVFTRSGEPPFRRAGDVAFIDPARANLIASCLAIAPVGGLIGVTGGTSVFEWFVAAGAFDAFHLVKAHGRVVKGGRPAFSSGPSATVLARANLILSRTEWLDRADGIALQVYERRATP
jgi:dihydrofolate reductase